MPVRLDDRIRPARQIDRHLGEGLIHRREAVAYADDALAVAEGFVERLSQCRCDVFHRVMSIYLQIAFGLHGEVEQSVYGKMSQHVVEEPKACGDFVFACSIQLQFDADLSFVRLT